MKKRLLFATSLIPSAKPSTGYEIANRAILDGLRGLGHDVVVMGYSEADLTGAIPSDMIWLGQIDVSNATASTVQKLKWLAQAVKHNTTFAGAKLLVKTDAEISQAIAERGPFDGIILNGVTLAAAFEKVLTLQDYIYIAHNVEFHSARQSAAAASSPLERMMFLREAQYLERIEKRLCANAAFVWTLSEEDRAPLGVASLGVPSLGVASDARSNVLSLMTRSKMPEHLPERHIKCDATLIGTWTWAPNRIGLNWFLNDVTPHLPDDFSFEIAGRMPDDLIIAHKGGKLVGRVDDATEFVRSGAVVPLVSRAGTGVQLKTIETFELGLPAVATSLSVRGIARLPSNCDVTDDPAIFAQILVATAKKVRAGALKDCDGAEFFDNQKNALEQNLVSGLACFSSQSDEALRAQS